MRFLRLAVAGLLLGAALMPQKAQADYFVWNDAKSGLSITYPDSWRQVSNQGPHDVLTVMPPSNRAQAQCTVRVEDEQRFLVYPPRYGSDIQKLAVSHQFWDRYLHQYDNHSIDALHDGAGLGRGHASYVVASYNSRVPGPDMSRRALMFASIYNDTLYVTECSSHADAFDSFQSIFLSVAGSVNFRKAHHETTVGHYRNFLADPNFIFIDTDGNKRAHY